MSYYFSKARQLISFAPTAPDAPTEAHPSKSIPTSTSSSSFPSNGRYGHDRYSLHPDTVVGRETYKKYATHAYDTALNRGIGGKGESVKGRGFCLLGLVDNLRTKSVVSPNFAQKTRKYLDNDELTEELLYLRNLIHHLKSVLKLWKVDPVRNHEEYAQAVDELEASKEKEPLELYIRSFLRWYQSIDIDEQDGILEKSDEEWPTTPELSNADESWTDMTASEYQKELKEFLGDDDNSWEEVYPYELDPDVLKAKSKPQESLSAPSDNKPVEPSSIIFTNTRAPRFIVSRKPKTELPEQAPAPPAGETPLPPLPKDIPGLTNPKDYPHREAAEAAQKGLTNPSQYHLATPVFDISGNMQAGEKRDYDRAFEESGKSIRAAAEMLVFLTRLFEDDEAVGYDEEYGTFLGEGETILEEEVL